MFVLISVVMLVTNIKHVEDNFVISISTSLNLHRIHIKFTSLARCEIFIPNYYQIKKILETFDVILCFQ